MDSEQEKFLSDKHPSSRMCSSEESMEACSCPKQKKKTPLSGCLPLIFHLLLITIYTTLFFSYWDYGMLKNGTWPSSHKPGIHAYCEFSRLVKLT